MDSAASRIGASPASTCSRRTRSHSSATFPRSPKASMRSAEDDFVLDGELVIVGGSFESLQLRLHPAESRIRKLARETPADDRLRSSGAFGISLLDRPLAERRRELEEFMGRAASPVLKLGSATEREAVARDWLGRRALMASSPSVLTSSTSRASGRCGNQALENRGLRRCRPLPKGQHPGGRTLASRAVRRTRKLELRRARANL